MGGGQNFRSDVPRRGNTSLLQAVAEVGASRVANGGYGSLAKATEFCALRHEVSFRLTAATPPAVGDSVALRLGDPPVVVIGTEAIGVVEGSSAAAMNGCMRMEWKMTGTVESIDIASGEGVAVVRGAR